MKLKNVKNLMTKLMEANNKLIINPYFYLCR